MEYAGENIVSGSAESLGKVTPADVFRRTVTRNSRIQPGKGTNEGYWVLAPEQSNTKVTNLLQKVNSSHGGETQASAGTLWEGGLNSDSRFPSVIFEGTMPETVGASWNSTLGKSIGRSNFIRQPSENLPIGTRLGFKTGEIPIHSTSSFVETSPGSGKFFYNGEIIPENRIFSPQQFSKSNGKTYLSLLERPSKLSEAERLGIPKGTRNQPDNTALPTRGFDVIPTNKNNFYRVSGPSEITDISEFGKLRIDPIARFDQMQLRIINEQTGIPMERLYEINASDNPRAIQNLVMESEAYKSASPFDQFNMKLSAARPKSNHGDKGFQRGAFFSIYDPNNPASKYYGAPTIVGTTRKSSFLGGHHGDYRGEWNLDIPVGSGQNSGSAVLRNGFEKENFKYWKLGNDGKWYLHNFKQGDILKRK